MLAASLAAFAQAKTAQSIGVSDAKQLVNAIASDRTIVLKKGDYLLSSAYGISDEVRLVDRRRRRQGAPALQAPESHDPRRRRGEDRLRLRALLHLGVYDSKNVTLDNIRFVRTPRRTPRSARGASTPSRSKAFASTAAPSRARPRPRSSSGSAGTRRSRGRDISGATSGALSASYTQGLELNGSRISDCEGYPLLYLENSDKRLSSRGRDSRVARAAISSRSTRNRGAAESIGFDACAFTGNQVDYFSGTQLLPTTDNCQFADNSFDEDWETRFRRPGER